MLNKFACVYSKLLINNIYFIVELCGNILFISCFISYVVN